MGNRVLLEAAVAASGDVRNANAELVASTSGSGESVVSKREMEEGKKRRKRSRKGGRNGRREKGRIREGRREERRRVLKKKG